jgi:hypothetical protein
LASSSQLLVDLSFGVPVQHAPPTCVMPDSPGFTYQRFCRSGWLKLNPASITAITRVSLPSKRSQTLEMFTSIPAVPPP